MWSSKDWGPVDIPPSQKEEAHRTETTFTGISASQPSFIHSFLHSTVFISINYVPAQIGNDKLRKEKNKTRQRRWQRQARWLYYYVSGEQGWPHWLDDIWAETGRKRGYRSRSHLMEEQSRQWEQKVPSPETWTAKRQVWLEQDKWGGKWEMKLGKEIIYGHCKDLIFSFK